MFYVVIKDEYTAVGLVDVALLLYFCFVILVCVECSVFNSLLLHARQVSLDLVVGDEICLAAKDGFDHGAGLVCLDVRDVVGLLPRGEVAHPLRVAALVGSRAVDVGVWLLGHVPRLEGADVALPLLEDGLAVVVGSAREVEVGYAEEVAMVGEGDASLPELYGAGDDVRDARGPVENREVRVVVQVNECHV